MTAPGIIQVNSTIRRKKKGTPVYLGRQVSSPCITVESARNSLKEMSNVRQIQNTNKSPDNVRWVNNQVEELKSLWKM